ncbi:hypothetical protein HD596_006091 [Nonomuraea jabiensis]|uniref:Uncharacterized protein n=1 Tax=Nonomuraea jabiensis TaxID=882448 RepID=A0A7W9LD17_9ACTN|nr:hypothetical protein [Nonomuraea jabiensis]
MEVACHVLDISVFGYYARRDRPPGLVQSAQGAVSVLPAFHSLSRRPEPAVRLSMQRALHVSCPVVSLWLPVRWSTGWE